MIMLANILMPGENKKLPSLTLWNASIRDRITHVFNLFSAGTVFRRQILKSKDGPRAEKYTNL